MKVKEYIERARRAGVANVQLKLKGKLTEIVLSTKQTRCACITDVLSFETDAIELLQRWEEGDFDAPQLPPDRPAPRFYEYGALKKQAATEAAKRKPLKLPLCRQCRAQPVQTASDEFCGHFCARDWHVENARKSAQNARQS